MLQVWQIGTLEHKYVRFLGVYVFCQPFTFQIVHKLEEVPSPSQSPPVQGLANAEEMAAPPKQSEVEVEVEEAARKSPLTQLQMIIECGQVVFLISVNSNLASYTILEMCLCNVVSVLSDPQFFVKVSNNALVQPHTPASDRDNTSNSWKFLWRSTTRNYCLPWNTSRTASSRCANRESFNSYCHGRVWVHSLSCRFSFNGRNER